MKYLLTVALLWIIPSIRLLAQDYNTSLQTELLQILETDQKYRIQMDSVSKTYGYWPNVILKADLTASLDKTWLPNFIGRTLKL